MPKMTIEYSKEVKKRLEKLAATEGRTPTEIIRRAIGVYDHIHEDLNARDDRVLAVADKTNGKVIKVLKWV